MLPESRLSPRRPRLDHVPQIWFPDTPKADLNDSPEILNRWVLGELNRYVDAQHYFLLASCGNELDGRISRSIQRKWHHCKTIQRQAERNITRCNGIIEGTDPEREWNTTQSTAIAILHDVWRPHEAFITGSYDGARTGVDHARNGSDLVINAFSQGGDLNYLMPYMCSLGCDIGVIAQAVDEHNKKKITVPRPTVYDRQIRDVDKHDDLLYVQEYQVQSMIDNPSTLDGPIESRVVEEFLSTEDHMVSSGNIHTYGGQTVCLAGWLFDIEFDATRQLLIEDNIPSDILRRLSTFEGSKPICDVFPTWLSQNWSERARKEYPVELFSRI